MSKKSLSLWVSLILIFLGSCSSPLPISPSPAVSATPSSGLPVAFGNISLVIPEGLASGASFGTSTNVEYPYINPSFGDMPEHQVVGLSGYPIQGGNPRIIIFPAERYAQYTEMTQNTILALQNLPAQSSSEVPEALSTTFFAQAKTFLNEHNQGLCYLTEVLTGYAPITNEDIFYYCQGLSLDGEWFIEAILPVQAPFLPADTNPNSVLPADGVPFPFNFSGDVNDIKKYYETIKAKLDTAGSSVFSPSLALMGELIQSIHISP
jgi:hypothetical protein